MNRPSSNLFRMGPLYEIVRGGSCVAIVHGLPSSDDDGKFVTLPHDTDIQEGDTLITKGTGERLPILKLSPVVRGSEIQNQRGYYCLTPRSDRSHTIVHQTIGTVHGSVAGRDIHGGANVGITGPELLEILRLQVEADPNIEPEHKKTLLQKIGDLAKDPKIIDLAATGLGALIRVALGLPVPPAP